jgi:hypothetical protein
MANTPPKPHDSKEESIELRPDGEERFRAAVHAAAKSGPKHREPKDR